MGRKILFLILISLFLIPLETHGGIKFFDTHGALEMWVTDIARNEIACKKIMTITPYLRTPNICRDNNFSLESVFWFDISIKNTSDELEHRLTSKYYLEDNEGVVHKWDTMTKILAGAVTKGKTVNGSLWFILPNRSIPKKLIYEDTFYGRGIKTIKAIADLEKKQLSRNNEKANQSSKDALILKDKMSRINYGLAYHIGGEMRNKELGSIYNKKLIPFDFDLVSKGVEDGFSFFSSNYKNNPINISKKLYDIMEYLRPLSDTNKALLAGQERNCNYNIGYFSGMFFYWNYVKGFAGFVLNPYAFTRGFKDSIFQDQTLLSLAKIKETIEDFDNETKNLKMVHLPEPYPRRESTHSPAPAVTTVQEGKVLFEQKCSVCHPPDRATARANTREKWSSIIKGMQGRKANWISDVDAEKILEYLSSAQ